MSCLGGPLIWFNRRLVPFSHAQFIVLGLLVTLLVPAQFAWSQSEPVLTVEEDWVLVLNQPDQTVDSPQFHTVMSPFADLDDFYAQVVWNYREVPNFVAGGLQLQIWKGADLVQSKIGREDQLSTAVEVITWTQVLSVDSGTLQFRIQDGQSSTWGSFGDGLVLNNPAYILNLNDYRTDTSVQNSCVTYGANRVALLAISEVRRYGASGLQSTEQEPKIVYVENAQ